MYIIKEKLKKNKNSNKIPINKLAIKLFKKLDKFSFFLQADIILIENQPSLINPTMKTISSLLFSYFNIRLIIDKFKYDVIIKFVSPFNKLKVNKDNILNDINLSDIKCCKKSEKYKITKKLGKIYTEIILKKYNHFDNLKNLEKKEKKDDLCDAFLLAYHYVYNI